MSTNDPKFFELDLERRVAPFDPKPMIWPQALTEAQIRQIVREEIRAETQKATRKCEPMVLRQGKSMHEIVQEELASCTLDIDESELRQLIRKELSSDNSVTVFTKMIDSRIKAALSKLSRLVTQV